MKYSIYTLVLIFIAGCAKPWEIAYEKGRIRKSYIKQNPQLSKEIITNIYDGRISIGMNKEQVILCIGKPAKIIKSVWISGNHETWEYGYFEMRDKSTLPFIDNTPLFHKKYLYFENDKLIGWQD